MFEMFKYETKRNSLPRKISEFREMYRKDIEEIIEPYGFVYEDRDEYYGSEFQPSKEKRKFEDLYYKNMPYGKLYLSITATGRMGTFDIHANLTPAIQEIANIEINVYQKKGIRNTDNILRWHEGHPSTTIAYDLLPSTHIMRDIERYQQSLKGIKENLEKYVIITTPKEFFELTKPDTEKFFSYILSNGRFDRLGYYLILAKLAGEDYYQKYANKYVELNKEEIQEKYKVDITKLKEFLDTYTVGSLA